MINEIIARLKSILAKGIIHLVEDGSGRQFCQITVLAGETKNRVERFQEFGFTSVPPKGTTAIVGFLGADRNNPVVIGTNDPATRPTDSNVGETILYDAFDQRIHLLDDGSILIKTGGKLIIQSADLVRMETGRFECTGDIIDQVDGTGQTMQGMRDTYNGHTHTGDSGGNTSNPAQQMGGGV